MDTEPDERNKGTGEICPTGDWIEQLNQIVQKPASEGLKQLSEALFAKELCLFDESSFPKYAARLFLCYHEEGLNELARQFQFCDSLKQSNAVLGTIYLASKKKYLDPRVLSKDSQRLKEPLISDSMVKVAHAMLVDIISQSIDQPDLFEVA